MSVGEENVHIALPYFLRNKKTAVFKDCSSLRRGEKDNQSNGAEK